MSDSLVLHHIEAECRLGVFDWEQKSAQTIWVDLELAIDAQVCAATDQVIEAIDYAKVVTAVTELAKSRPFNLLETLAESVASLILERFATNAVKVRIQKRALAGMDYAAVEICRPRARATPARRARRRSRVKVG